MRERDGATSVDGSRWLVVASSGDRIVENRVAVTVGNGTSGERQRAWAVPRLCLRVSV